MNKQEALRILGLSGDVSASDIKQAYRKKAMETHPDKHAGDKAAEERFKQVSDAYSYLTNPNPEGQNSRAFSDYEDFVRDFFSVGSFGFRRTSAPRSKEIPTKRAIKLPDSDLGSMNMSLEKVLFAEPSKINLRVQAFCPDCMHNSNYWYKCDMCQGTGVILKQYNSPVGVVQNSTMCYGCKGEGWRGVRTCRTCKDKRIVTKQKEIKVNLSRNLDLSKKIRVAKVGNEGLNVNPSDVYLSINVNMPDISKLTGDDKKRLKELLSKA